MRLPRVATPVKMTPYLNVYRTSFKVTEHIFYNFILNSYNNLIIRSNSNQLRMKSTKVLQNKNHKYNYRTPEISFTIK